MGITGVTVCVIEVILRYLLLSPPDPPSKPYFKRNRVQAAACLPSKLVKRLTEAFTWPLSCAGFWFSFISTLGKRRIGHPDLSGTPHAPPQ